MEYKILLLWEVKAYINKIPENHRQKVDDLIELLRVNRGILDYPFSSHLRGRIRELRIGIGNFKHRILYTLAPDKQIILITAFLKKTKRVPSRIIDKAEKIIQLYFNQT